MAAPSAQTAGRGGMPMEPYPSDAGGYRQITCNVSSPPVPDPEDFDPQPRDRCNSWPLQKSSRGGDFVHHASPLIHEEIPEEGSDSGSVNDLSIDPHQRHQHLHSGSTVGGLVSPSGLGADLLSLSQTAAGDFSAAGKRSSSRRNAWGNLSYADLITQAIISTPDKRLTLSQIYDWMVKNVPYFRDKGDSNSSAGWKNSIRHNLSLHSRFMRIQNEGPGKSSWWVIDPDAKPGKSSRRRAGSMEISKKLEKKRGRVRKKMEQLRSINGGQLAVTTSSDLAAAASGGGGPGSATGSQAQLTVLSPSSMSESPDFMDGGGGGSSMISFSLSPANDFRNRSNSAVSSYSLGAAGGHLSPKFESHFEDWVDDVPSMQQHVGSGGAAELVESMSHSMSLVEPPPYASPSSSSMSSGRGFLFAGDDDGPPVGQQRHASPAASYLVVSPQQQQHHARMGVLSSSSSSSTSAQGLSPQSLVTAKNPVLYQSSGLKVSSTGAVDQPLPQYRDLFGASSHQPPPLPNNPNGGRMLRQVLTKSAADHPSGALLLGPNYNNGDTSPSSRTSSAAGVAMLQQRSPMRQLHQTAASMMHPCTPPFSVAQDMSSTVVYSGGGHQSSSSSAMLHSNGQLPTELSEIMYDTEIQCDIDQVIRHELNIAGNLDFSADNFGNI